MHKAVLFRPCDFTVEESLGEASDSVRAALEKALQEKELGFEDGLILANQTAKTCSRL